MAKKFSESHSVGGGQDGEHHEGDSVVELWFDPAFLVFSYVRVLGTWPEIAGS